MSDLFVTFYVLLVFACGIFVGVVWRRIFGDPMLDWKEGYEACKRDWDDWERARLRGEMARADKSPALPVLTCSRCGRTTQGFSDADPKASAEMVGWECSMEHGPMCRACYAAITTVTVDARNG